MAGCEIFRPFCPSTALRACCCTSRLCLRPTVLVILDRRRFHGLIASMMLSNDGGRRYPLARPAMENSPYQEMSSFVGNVLLLISPDALIAGQCYAGERSRESMPAEREDVFSEK